MQTQSERVSRERKSQMCFRRFSTWMFELEISTIRARREKRVCGLSTMGLLRGPLAQRLPVEVDVCPGRRLPGEVPRHPPADDRVPAGTVRVRRQRPRHGALQVLRLIPPEGEP